MLPTHFEITAHLQKLLPTSNNAREVPFFWHTPRHASYNPLSRSTTTVILGITATPGFYTAVNDKSRSSPAVCFLHRPWSLNRREVRHGSLILASHASFDEHLTVGWNAELAKRIGLDLNSAICIRGYKGNPERKIGLVARVSSSRSSQSLAESLKREFDGAGELHTTISDPVSPDVESNIRIVAIMNAFHADEIHRVLDVARRESWIDEGEDGSSILYLTGEARDYGLEAIKEVNMLAFCVGHRACEEWGVRYLASQIRSEWPQLEVVEVLEEEQAPIKASEEV